MADLFLFIRVSMEGEMMEAEGVDLKGTSGTILQSNKETEA